ncbi:hypothetical protein MMC22_007063 [Lobaria immixta]|nr:hypothetical protein [Lobaria immixta]
MASPTIPPPPFLKIPDFDLYDASMQRYWPCKAINEFIVGRLFAAWTDDHAVEYLRWVYHDFLNVTLDDVQHMWRSVILSSPHYQIWRARNVSTPEVIQTLDTIKIEWNMWRDPDQQIQ